MGSARALQETHLCRHSASSCIQMQYRSCQIHKQERLPQNEEEYSRRALAAAISLASKAYQAAIAP